MFKEIPFCSSNNNNSNDDNNDDDVNSNETQVQFHERTLHSLTPIHGQVNTTPHTQRRTRAERMFITGRPFGTELFLLDFTFGLSHSITERIINFPSFCWNAQLCIAYFEARICVFIVYMFLSTCRRPQHPFSGPFRALLLFLLHNLEC